MCNNTGNHSIAVIKGVESYESLKSFKPVLDTINKLVKQGTVSVKGKVYSLEFFLEGDYKVLGSTYTYTIYYTHSDNNFKSDF